MARPPRHLCRGGLAFMSATCREVALTMFVDPIWLWVGFALFVAAMLVLDLGVFHRKSHTVVVKEALAWSAVWVSLALLFAACVYMFGGRDKGLEFLAGYLIEWS